MEYELKNIDKDVIQDYLRANYDLSFAQVEFRPVGSGSWAYDLITQEKERYIVKIFKKNDPINEETFTTLADLNGKEVFSTLDLIRLRNSSYVGEIKDHKALVYKFIKGDVVASTKIDPLLARQIGNLLGRLHVIKLPEHLHGEIYTESFSQFLPDAHKVIQTLVSFNFHKEEATLGLLELYQKNKDTIDLLLKSTPDKNNPLRKRNLVPTHGDAHVWNILRTDGGLRFIDWEGFGFALPERDLMHYSSTKRVDFKFVLEGYREVVPDYEPDLDALAYYENEWMLQEIADYGNAILFSEIDDNSKVQALEELAAYFR